jgi:DNA replication initiation complex subunit (GINS family)
MPRLDELPEGMKALVRRHYRLARPDPDFHKDVGRLIIDLEQQVEKLVPQRVPETQIDTNQQRLEQYRDEVRHCLQTGNGKITPIGRSILDHLQRGASRG